ncbi:MAG: PAS domain S-box protein [Deltaproteobacteria bacterium]|nr:PAS domain S-box protein [Deltaproteobacteria bacterium]
MKDQRKTKEQLINELEELRRRISRLEAFESEHIPLETSLMHAEHEEQTIRDSLIEHVVYHDLEMKVLWANRAACNSVGMRREALVGRHCYEIWADRLEPCEDCPVRLARETGRPQALEKKTQDGRSWYVQGYPVVDTDGDVVGMVELTLEITERTLTEEALQKSEKQYRVLIDTIPHGIQEIDLAGTITFANSAHNKIYGYSDQEMIGKSILDLQISDSEKSGLGSYLAKLVREQPEPIPYLAKNLTKDGSLIDVRVDWNYKRDNQDHVTGFISVVTDITKQKQAEVELQKAHDELEQRVKERTAELLKTNEQLRREIEQRKETEKALQESQKKYRMVVENATEGIVVIQDGRLKFVNPQVVDFLGYSEEQLSSKPFGEFIHPDDQEMVLERYVRRLRGEWVSSIYPFRVIKRNGDVRWIEVKPVLTRWEGKPATLSFITDITERKEAEDALRESEAQKRAILDASPDRVFYVNKDMGIMWANKTATAGLKMSPEDLAGQTCHKLFVGKDTPCDGCPTLKARETEQIERAVMYKPRIMGIEGESYWDVYCLP